MKLQLFIQKNPEGDTLDVSNITGPIQITDSIEGDAGKLTCLLEKDPTDKLILANGNKVVFIVDDKTIFVGYIFTIGTDAEGNYKITAYDQMRYLKNQDARIFKNVTASDIFKKICEDYNLKYEIKAPTSFIPTTYKFSGKTLYNIIERGMQLAYLNDKKYYFIKDEAGTLTWNALNYTKTNYVLGDGSLVYGYKYEKSIDDDTYNRIRFYKENDEIGIKKWDVEDETTIPRWGILQYLKKIDDKYNEAQLKQLGLDYLKAFDYETEKLSIQADGIPELTAGRGFRFRLDREKIDTWMWITSSTHNYTKYEHTMELEVDAFNGEWREQDI